MNTTPLLTYREAADALSVSSSTIYRLIKRGDLVPVRLPTGAVRIPADQVRALAEGAP